MKDLGSSNTVASTTCNLQNPQKQLKPKRKRRTTKDSAVDELASQTLKRQNNIQRGYLSIKTSAHVVSESTGIAKFEPESKRNQNFEQKVAQRVQQQHAGSQNETSHANEDNLCAGCRAPIRERFFLAALDKRWHEDCLKCVCCDCRLGELGSTLFFRAEQILCRRDFLRIFCPSGNCSACKKIIQPYELVMRARQHAYHLDCFKCQQCKYRFCVGDKFRLLCDSRTTSISNNEEFILCIECFSSTTNAPEDNNDMDCGESIVAPQQTLSVASSSRSSSSLVSLSPPPSSQVQQAPQQQSQVQSLLSASLSCTMTKKTVQKQIKLMAG